jgi:hypothetical protein
MGIKKEKHPPTKLKQWQRHRMEWVPGGTYTAGEDSCFKRFRSWSWAGGVTQAVRAPA